MTNQERQVVIDYLKSKTSELEAEQAPVPTPTPPAAPTFSIKSGVYDKPSRRALSLADPAYNRNKYAGSIFALKKANGVHCQLFAHSNGEFNATGRWGFYVDFNPSNKLTLTVFRDPLTKSGYLESALTFSDINRWYHILFHVDLGNIDPTKRLRLFVDRVEVTTFSVRENPTLNASWNCDQPLSVGGCGTGLDKLNYFWTGSLCAPSFYDGILPLPAEVCGAGIKVIDVTNFAKYFLPGDPLAYDSAAKLNWANINGVQQSDVLP